MLKALKSDCKSVKSELKKLEKYLDSGDNNGGINSNLISRIEKQILNSRNITEVLQDVKL